MMNKTSWKGTTSFSRITNMELNKDGRVDSFLDSQFTVNYDDGTFGFLFNKDKNVTWKPLNEKKRVKRRGSSQYMATTDTTSTFDSFNFEQAVNALSQPDLTFDQLTAISQSIIEEDIEEETL